MRQPTTKEERKLRDADFAERLKPRMLWPSTQEGTAIATRKGYRAKPPVEKVKHRPTEAEDNARGRAIRRRTNKAMRGWLPYAQR